MEDYKIIGWPEIQNYMDFDDFDDNATLIEPNVEMGIDDQTYLVDAYWLDSLNK